VIVRRRVCAAVAIGLLVAGCSAAPAAAPFRGLTPAPPGDYISGEVVTGKIYDVEGVLQNYSPDRVRLTSLRLIAPAGPGIRLLNIRAYLLSQTGGIGDVDEGNLAKNCPELYKPRPVTDVVVAPRSSSKWVIAVALIFRKPGKYHLGLLRIGYIAAGHAGWQRYYIRNLNLTAVPPQAAPPHLYQPTRCSKNVAPRVATYFLYNASLGFSRNPGGVLFASGDVGAGAVVRLGTSAGTSFTETVTGGTWRRTGKTVALCLHLIGGSPKAPGADTICGHGIPISGAPVRVTDDHGRVALIRVSWIPGAP
jgi:hypothetical protein